MGEVPQYAQTGYVSADVEEDAVERHKARESNEAPHRAARHEHEEPHARRQHGPCVQHPRGQII